MSLHLGQEIAGSLGFGLATVWSVSLLILMTQSSRWRRAAACGFSTSLLGLISLPFLPVSSSLIFQWIHLLEAGLIRAGLKSIVLPFDPFLPYFALFGCLAIPMVFGAWLGWWMTKE